MIPNAAKAILAACLALLGSAAEATPLLALKEAENCQACHNKGRSQRPFFERRCTLDCQGCHIDPAGAGPRNAWGYYYMNAELAPVKFYQPQDPLKDASYFDVHADSRIINRRTDDKDRTFPMSAEYSLRVRPFVEYLHFTYQAMLLGRIEDAYLRADRNDPRRYREKYSVMIDKIPLNLYARAYRGPPMYGLRRPNHSLWIRERIGLDQFATTEALEAGGTPNVPFLRYSVMTGDPYAREEDRQKGTTFHGGFRGVTLGWHLNGSTWDSESEKAKIKMRALGGGLKPWKFIFMGERNWRQVEEKVVTPAVASTFESRASRVHPSSEITEWTAAFAGIPGVIVGAVQEYLSDPTNDSQRRSYFVDLHPIPYLQIEIWRRHETGTRSLADTLAIGHLYYDF
jgi:hypothetical protein